MPVIHFSYCTRFFFDSYAYGSMPDSIFTSIQTPTPNGENTITANKTSHQGVALSFVKAQLFDNVVLLRYRDKLVLSELQFRFKSKYSTNLCTKKWDYLLLSEESEFSFLCNSYC
jgi:hypothetical protein